MATCSSCGNTTTKCGCKDTPLTTPPSYTCPPSDSCPDPTPCFETIQDTCVIHSLNYGLPCLGVTAGMTLEQILQVINNTLNSIGDGTLSTSDEGALVEASTTAMNFVGPLVNAVSAGANSVTVNVNGNLVADLDDVNQNGFSTLANLLTNTTFDFIAAPPASFGDHSLWLLDLITNTSLSELYAVVYDPVDSIWRPFNIAFLINEVVCTFYSQNGFISGDRTVGLNNSSLTFTNDIQSDCKGDSSAKGAGNVVFKLADDGLTAGTPGYNLYTNGQVRLSHTMIYNKNSATYQNYADWLAAGNPNTIEEQRSLQLGRFTDAYNVNIYQASGYERTPSVTSIEIYSNPIKTTNVNEAYERDAQIFKNPDEYDVIDQATRVITGGGHLYIQRLSPTSQHATAGDDVGLGSIFLLHGSSTASDPNAELQYTGQWTWSKYGVGTFTGTPAYMLATTSTGDIIELSGTELQQEFLTEIQQGATTSWQVSSANNGKLIELDNAAAISLNVVLNSTLAIPIGTRIEFYQKGAGVVTITPAGGVTINSRGGLLSSNGQYAKFELIKTNTDEWLASGDLA